MEGFIGLGMGFVLGIGLATSTFFSDTNKISSFPLCIEKQFGKEVVKKCYDVIEVKK